MAALIIRREHQRLVVHCAGTHPARLLPDLPDPAVALDACDRPRTILLGLANIQRLMQDTVFRAFGNTMIFLAVQVPIKILARFSRRAERQQAWDEAALRSSCPADLCCRCPLQVDVRAEG
jgi:hypothetical protein